MEVAKAVSCSKCDKPATYECDKTPNGGWGTLRCGVPLCNKCKCDCDKVLID